MTVRNSACVTMNQNWKKDGPKTDHASHSKCRFCNFPAADIEEIFSEEYSLRYLISQD